MEDLNEILEWDDKFKELVAREMLLPKKKRRELHRLLRHLGYAPTLEERYENYKKALDQIKPLPTIH